MYFTGFSSFDAKLTSFLILFTAMSIRRRPQQRLYAANNWQAIALRQKLPKGWNVIFTSTEGERQYLELEWGISRVSTLEDLLYIIQGTQYTLKDFKHLNKRLGPKLRKKHLNKDKEIRKEIKEEIDRIHKKIQERLANLPPTFEVYAPWTRPGSAKDEDCSEEFRCLFCVEERYRERMANFDVEIVYHPYNVRQVKKWKIKREPLEESDIISRQEKELKGCSGDSEIISEPTQHIESMNSEVLINISDLLIPLCTPSTEISAMCQVNDTVTKRLDELGRQPRPAWPQATSETEVVYSLKAKPRMYSRPI